MVLRWRDYSPLRIMKGGQYYAPPPNSRVSYEQSKTNHYDPFLTIDHGKSPTAFLGPPTEEGLCGVLG